MADCIFCKIANKEIPSEIVYEDDFVVSFKDLDPKAPVHVLIIPKKHYGSALEINDENCEIVGHVFSAAAKIAKKLGIDTNGFRIVNNCGSDGGQTVGHIHFHLLGGRNLGWPPG